MLQTMLDGIKKSWITFLERKMLSFSLPFGKGGQKPQCSEMPEKVSENTKKVVKLMSSVLDVFNNEQLRPVDGMVAHHVHADHQEPIAVEGREDAQRASPIELP